MFSRREKLTGYAVVVLVGIVAAEILRYMAFHGMSHIAIIAVAVAVVVLMIVATIMVARR
jgi:hypothetical protein